MAVSPPFNIDTSSPAASDNISAYPANEQANRDIIASWLAFISDPATGLIKSAALPTELELENLTVTGDILMPTGGSAIHPGTEDGSDNGYVTLSGGGDGGGVSRGAYFRAFGNESSVTPGNAYVVAGATGTVQLVGDTVLTGALNVSGMTTSASFKSTQNYVGGGNVVLSPNAAGTVYLRPNGAASGTGQTTIASTGAMSVGGAIVAAGNITANNAFATPGATHILATGTAGTIYMRPNGVGSATGQATLGSGGTFTASAFAGNGAAITGLTSGQITGALGYTPVDKAGDTMTGLLTLSGDPTSNLHAATKQYVDNNSVAIDRTVITASGTWTKPAGLDDNSLVLVEAWGGGGGSGTGNNSPGGGGGGAYVSRLFLASELSSTVSVTVGAAGIAGNGATDGGNTSFGSYFTAYGGAGGDNEPTHHGGGGGGIFGAGNGAVGGKGDGGNGIAGTGVSPTADAIYGGGGGASGTTAGSSLYGGGGGSSSGGNGGISIWGGNGGGANGAAQAPGGGGGNGGNGARGEVRVTIIGN